MFRRTVCVLVILCSYASAFKSSTLNTDSLSETGVKYHSTENDRLREMLSPLKNEETRTKMRTVRQAAAKATIVNDDFDISSDINNQENSSEIIGILYVSEGSGDDEFVEGKGMITTQETKSESQFVKRTNATTSLAQPTTSEIKYVTTSAENEEEISALTDAESSGDDILLFTKESTTEIHATQTPGDTVEEIIPDICLNSTCDVNDLSVSVSDDRDSIAEGTNFTLSCKTNSSNHMLYWYKSNGSVYFLQQFGTTKELYLNIPDTKPVHSGRYICVRWVDEHTCCNLELHLSVYELPLYKYHLIILALIAAACLIICIFLSIRQVISLKVYTKQFVEKHGNGKKQQLL